MSLIGLLVASIVAAPLWASDVLPTDVPDRPTIDSSGIRAKKLMRLGGIGPDEWAQFQDSRTSTEPEREILQKILFRLASLPGDQLEHLAETSINWQRLRDDPAAYRGHLVRLVGQVRSVEVIRLPKSWADRFGLKQYYHVVMDVDDEKRPVVVFSRTVPKPWRAGGSIDQPGGAWAMFVKLEHDDAGQARPVFAAPRVAWHPEDQLLGQLGMDVGLLDDLADRRPLRHEERECFYQLLAAAGRAKPGQLEKTAKALHSVEPLFNKPTAQRGKLASLSGTARRVLLVRVDDPDIQRRLGIDHYYEIHLFTGDSEGNPLVFCVTRLPEGMPTGDGPDYAEPVSVTGFFLKSWAYPSGRTAEAEKDDQPAPLQLAPLLVGREAVWHPSSQSTGSSIGGIVGAVLFVLVLLVIWLWLLKIGRNDRKQHRMSRKARTIDLNSSLNQPAEELDRILDPSNIDKNPSPDA